MKNPFPYSSDNKRYHTLHFHNMREFGCKVYKAPVDAGFTCPNIDGSKGVGGCIYCSGGSGYFTKSPLLSVSEQLNEQIRLIHNKHPEAKVIAYFQSYTNTYAPVEKLRKKILPALVNPYVAGISVATRADCISDECLDFLSFLSKRTKLTVELGLQTVHDKTAELINRCHSYSQFTQCFYRLKDRGIRTTVHIINGLPGENREMMLETAETVGKLAPDGLKIHLLHVIKGTVLEKMYLNGEYIPMEKDDYVETVVEQLRYIPPETVIERLTGDGDKRTLIAPDWSKDKISVLGAIDKLQSRLDSFQGDKLL